MMLMMKMVVKNSGCHHICKQKRHWTITPLLHMSNDGIGVSTVKLLSSHVNIMKSALVNVFDPAKAETMVIFEDAIGAVTSE